MVACAALQGSLSSCCRKRSTFRTPAELHKCRPTDLQVCRSEAVCRFKVRRIAREACVARYYDPATGQFLSIDPLVAWTQAPYSYVANDPLNAVDPFGLWGCWSFHCIVSDISVAAGAVSAVTALIPGLEWVSEGAALIAFGADLANCATGECDWANIALDALSLIPGAAAIRFASKAAKIDAEITAAKALGRIDKSLESNKGFQKLLAKLAGLTGAQLSGASTTIAIGLNIVRPPDSPGCNR